MTLKNKLNYREKIGIFWLTLFKLGKYELGIFRLVKQFGKNPEIILLLKLLSI